MATLTFNLSDFASNQGLAPDFDSLLAAIKASGVPNATTALTVHEEENSSRPSAVVVELEGTLSPEDRRTVETLVATFRNPDLLNRAKARAVRGVRREIERLRSIRRVVALSDAEVGQEEERVRKAIADARSLEELRAVDLGLGEPPRR